MRDRGHTGVDLKTNSVPLDRPSGTFRQLHVLQLIVFVTSCIPSSLVKDPNNLTCILISSVGCLTTQLDAFVDMR